jgi:tungstate transport system ATP-binding protein
LQKRFGDRLLYNIASLKIEAGKAYALTGANGTGKSTLLRILSGLDSASVDQVIFQGQTMSLAPYPAQMRKAIIYVHQHPVMFSSSIVENIAYGLKARGLQKHDVDGRVEEAMQWAKVAHLQNRHPSVLSGGEKQRVALARAWALSPRLLLLDEPTANLDGPAKEQVIELIPDLVRSGSSVIMACHDRQLIELPAVERWVIRGGQLEAVSSEGLSV